LDYQISAQQAVTAARIHVIGPAAAQTTRELDMAVIKLMVVYVAHLVLQAVTLAQTCVFLTAPVEHHLPVLINLQCLMLVVDVC